MPVEIWTLENTTRGAAFVAVAATAAHVLFSRFGFNPTDDGFILAGSRRIRDGEVPHRDFISIRPALSHVLHVPVLVLGGDRTILLGRYVFWLQMAFMAWIWSCIYPTPAPLALAVLAFVLSAGVFPVMPWHTVDALFFATLGISLLPGPYGILVAAIAPLCRQNFALLLPLLALTSRGPESGIVLLPCLAYAGWVWARGGLSDMWQQLTVYQGRSALHVGVRMYANVWTLLGLAFGVAVAGERAATGWAVAVVPVVWICVMCVTGEANRMSYFVFGMTLPTLLTVRAPEDLFPVALAWVSSLSVGYPVPALASGAMFAAVAGSSGVSAEIVLASAAASSIAFFFLRRRHVYRQGPAIDLTEELGGVLPGARGVLTDKTTREVLHDLARLASSLDSRMRHYAILPDLSAFWITSVHRNPISCDWPQDTELGSEALLDRVRRDLGPSKALDVIVQKFEAKGLRDGVVPLLPNRYRIVRFSLESRPQTESTTYFTVLGTFGGERGTDGGTNNETGGIAP